MGFRLVPKYVTLNDLVNGAMAIILPYFAEFDSFRQIIT